MTRTRLLAITISGLAVFAGAALALPLLSRPDARPPLVAAGGAPVLLELFTSQGCSSCPPADALAEKLAREPGLVVLTRPVTYWDRLGWKDTLARESNTALQQDYARRGLAGTNGVYTPQLVVNGRLGAIGSHAEDIAAAIGRYGQPGGTAITLSPQGAGDYEIGLSGKAVGNGELVLVAVTRQVDVAIGSGENGGRRVAYANVVREERKISDWQGGAATVALHASQLQVPGADRYALVLRQPAGGAVLAARWLS